VAVSGDTVVVGAYAEDSSTTGVNSTPNESATGSGAAYVFVRSAGVWTQQAYLKPAAVGTSEANDLFGISVAVSGDTVVVGAYAEDSSTTGVNSTPDERANASGAAYVFLVVNTPPIAPEQTFTRGMNLTLKIKIADVLAACSDPDGGTPAFQSVGASVQGATISTTATHILYSLAANANDSFPYTITDGQGGTTTGTLKVQVVNPGGLAQSISTSGSAVTVNFAGIPGFTYDIQRATTLTPTPDWATVATRIAPANGLFSYIDPSPPTPTAFYRLMQSVAP